MATEAAIIAWTPSNWITIILMVAITFFVAGALAKVYQQRKGNSASAAS